MSEIKAERISEAVTLKSFTDPRFKTMKISVDMLVPLTKATAASYAVLASLVSRASREYPDYTALSCKLAELYGASLDSSVRKFGEYQVLTLSAGGISSRYAFGGEDMFAELTHLLFSILFDPFREEDGSFPRDGFEQEKRQMLEMKDSEFNDKITYAHQRCEEILFEGQNAGVNRCGSREEIEALNRESLTEVWKELLASAKFEIFALGDCRPDPELFRAKFRNLGRARDLSILPYCKPDSVKRVTEEQPLSQSKLSLAFRADAAPEERLLFQLMSAVLGGTPSSKLFQNVREKMSLCYYCSAGLLWNSRALFVESGVETENIEKTETAVLDQLKSLQNGEVTEEELLSAKLALCNSLRSVGDSLHAVENWYLSRSFENSLETPEQAAERLMAYTAEDVVRASQKLQLAAVYCLKGSETH